MAPTASHPTPTPHAPARWAPPGRAAARWRGALLLVPLVVALHAAVVFGAWQAAERAPVRSAALPPPQRLPAATPAPRDLRLVAVPPLGGDGSAGDGDGHGHGHGDGHGASADADAAPLRTVLHVREAGAGGPARAMAATAAGTTMAAEGMALPALPAGTAAGAAAADRAAAPVLPVAEVTAPVTAAVDPAKARVADPGAAAPASASADPAPQAAAQAQPRAAPFAAVTPAQGPTGAPTGTPAQAPTQAPDGTVASAVSGGAADSGPVAAGASAPGSDTPPPSLPVYRGEAPPAATLHFSLRRAAVGGRGQLDWRPGPEGYELTLQATVLGLRALQQTSRGRWDLGGLAPERFLDTRRGRETRAANFRHDVGLISYSGPSQTYPLLRGSQDRLSWMLHLPAVMQANPALRAVGAELRMFVSGARGDGDIWAFRVVSVDRLALPVGEVAGALHLRRLPRHEHDTQADIWLDPARHHLPVRVRLQSGDDVFELVLDRLEGG